MPVDTPDLSAPDRLAPLLGADVDPGGAFLPWVNHLYEVGDGLRSRRAKALDTAAEAAGLELHALRLRKNVDDERAAILDTVAFKWKPSEIAEAVKHAEQRSVRLRQLRAVPDAALSAAIEQLDGTHLASQALAAFAAVRLPAADAPEAEVREALERARTWFDLAAAPVLTRLNAASRRLERRAEPL